MSDFALFHFLRPWWLLALLPWFMFVVLTIRHKLSRGNWSEVCDEPLLPYILQDKAVHRSRTVLISGALASLLAILALAGPTWERLPTPTFRDDSAVVIALDLSRSMDAADLKPSRLERARFKIADILKQRKDGQTALLVYAGDAFTVTPLTSDTRTIASQLPALTTDIMPVQGSDTISALNLAVDLLKQAGMQKGHILFVTDDVDDAKLEAVVKQFGAYSLSILGVGTADGAPISDPGSGFIKDRYGNIVVPKLNADKLRRLASLGNGTYRTISPDDSDIETLLATFDSRLAQNDAATDELLLDLWAERGPWLLLLVLPLAALSFRKGVLSIALLTVLPFPNEVQALDWNDLWQKPDQQAQQAFSAGQYERAAELFDDSEWKAAAEYKAGRYEQSLETLEGDTSARGFYNRGNALAQSGQLADAVKAYEEALKIDPDHQDAAYNKELVEKELEKQQQQQSQQGGDKQQESDQSSEQDDPGDEPSDDSEQQSSESGDQDKPRPSSEPQQDQKDAGNEDTEADTAQSQKQTEDSDENETAEQPKQAAETDSADEAKQASEQWLKRIPDDPAGLLRRKFEYQYGRRGRQQQQNEAW